MNKKMMEKRNYMLKMYLGSLIKGIHILDNSPIKPYYGLLHNNLSIYVDIEKYVISIEFCDKNVTYHFINGKWFNPLGIEISNLHFNDVKRVHDTCNWLLKRFENNKTI